MASHHLTSNTLPISRSLFSLCCTPSLPFSLLLPLLLLCLLSSILPPAPRLLQPTPANSSQLSQLQHLLPHLPHRAFPLPSTTSSAHLYQPTDPKGTLLSPHTHPSRHLVVITGRQPDNPTAPRPAYPKLLSSPTSTLFSPPQLRRKPTTTFIMASPQVNGDIPSSVSSAFLQVHPSQLSRAQEMDIPMLTQHSALAPSELPRH